MKPMSKARKTERLKQKNDKLLSNFAFKFDLRHYNPGLVCQPTTGHRGAPFLLHLDSMAGGAHNTDYVVSKLREYLAAEWLRLKVEAVTAAEKALPLPGSGSGAGAGGTSGAETTAADAIKKARAAATAAAVPGLFGKKALPHKQMNVPQQNNDSDCGLYLLTCIERVVSGKMPALVTAEEITAAADSRASLKGSKLPTGFLRQDWFVGPQTARLQRSHITLLILEQLFDAQIAQMLKAEAAAEAEGTEVEVAVVEAQRKVRMDISEFIKVYRARVERHQSAVDAAEVRVRTQRVRAAQRDAGGGGQGGGGGGLGGGGGGKGGSNGGGGGDGKKRKAGHHDTQPAAKKPRVPGEGGGGGQGGGGGNGGGGGARHKGGGKHPAGRYNLRPRGGRTAAADTAAQAEVGGLAHQGLSSHQPRGPRRPRCPRCPDFEMGPQIGRRPHLDSGHCDVFQRAAARTDARSRRARGPAPSPPPCTMHYGGGEPF